jgi:hypothetical protein
LEPDGLLETMGCLRFPVRYSVIAAKTQSNFIDIGGCSSLSFMPFTLQGVVAHGRVIDQRGSRWCGIRSKI